MLRTLLPAVLLLPTCTPTTNEIVSSQPLVNQAIVRGEACATDPAVVAVLVRANPPDPLLFQCTGTLIAPDVVLTAAHCVYQPLVAIDEFVVSTDTDVSGTFNRARFVEVVGSWFDPAFPTSDGGTRLEAPTHDVALLFLAEPLSATPIFVPTVDEDTALSAGDPIRLVGYGQDGEGLAGVKRCAASTLTDLGSTLLQVGDDEAPTICFGDSGAPVFATFDGDLRVIGVNGFSSCDAALLASPLVSTSIEPRSTRRCAKPATARSASPVTSPACPRRATGTRSRHLLAAAACPQAWCCSCPR